jgi:hypothetical protein
VMHPSERNPMHTRKDTQNTIDSSRVSVQHLHRPVAKGRWGGGDGAGGHRTRIQSSWISWKLCWSWVRCGHTFDVAPDTKTAFTTPSPLLYSPCCMCKSEGATAQRVGMQHAS